MAHMTYLVTRHAGALEWVLQQIGRPVVHIEHLDAVPELSYSDTVVGTLPLHLIAEVCRQGARYLHLDVALPQQLRGQELSAQQLTKLGASLVEYVVYSPGADTADEGIENDTPALSRRL